MFPYLSRWEKASDLRFKCGDAFLSPYPYVCIVYTELHSRQKRLFLDKTEYRDNCNFAGDTSELSMCVDTERAMKWSKQECTAEISYVQHYNDRNVARSATCIYGTTWPHVGRTRLQKDVIHPTENLPDETRLRYCGAAIVNSGYDNMTLGEHVELDMAENGQQDGRVLVLPQGPEEHTEWDKRGFLAVLKRQNFFCLLPQNSWPTWLSEPSGSRQVHPSELALPLAHGGKPSEAKAFEELEPEGLNLVAAGAAAKSRWPRSLEETAAASGLGGEDGARQLHNPTPSSGSVRFSNKGNCSAPHRHE
ncbi:uncharacterized protein LOC132582788 [Heteronotia binoei]|uniref:uncharacterized protein LOC132582788 n=1 Tax=Heteronotia binoei TaxID=13085 RepID=UPI00292DD7D4|nr:uncharacterized protein LOC132582788 [Heteronotia binoei]